MAFYYSNSTSATAGNQLSAAMANFETAAQTLLGSNSQDLQFLTYAALAEMMARLNGANGANAVTYHATTMAPAVGYTQNNITPTDTVAFLVGNPTGTAAVGDLLRLRFLNSSGGTMGDPTFGSQYKIGATFAKPANGKSRYYWFGWTGTTWEEVTRSAADSNP